jgi:hypothetical protein
MSVTILQQPATPNILSVINPIEFLISSNNSALANFKFQVSVYYDPAGANTLLAQLRYDIIPSTTKALVDVSRILQSRIAENITTLNSQTTVMTKETTKLHKANVVFQDYFGTIPAASGSTTTSNTIYFYNGAFTYREFVKDYIAKYRLSLNAVSNQLDYKILTSFNNFAEQTQATVAASGLTFFKSNYTRVVKYGQFVQFNFLWHNASQGANMTVNQVTNAGVSTSLFSGSIVAAIQYVSKLLLVTGLADDIKYLTMAIRDSSYQVTGTYLFEIDKTCSRFDSYELHWLNRLGGWDSWVFDKRSQHNIEIIRKQYNPTFSPVSGNSIVRNTFDATNKNFVVSTKERYRLTSNYLNQNDLDGLQDLICSPLVYWRNGNDFISIAISNPETFEFKKNNVDKNFVLNVEFEIDNQDIRQLP